MAHFTTVPVVDGAGLGQRVAVPLPRLLFRRVTGVMYMVYFIYYMLCYYSVLCCVFYAILYVLRVRAFFISKIKLSCCMIIVYVVVLYVHVHVHGST